MATNYDFLRTFTFDNKETNHLFQVAKVTIPFLSKENAFYTVGNTDGKVFNNTRIGDYTITIDGFIIKDNTGKSVSDSIDELKQLINSNEPKQLIFDVFPDRYFNAIFSGTQEYDATNLDYTPLTLVFDVPEGLAHSVEPSGFSNVYTDGTNLMLDSEFNNIPKYMVPWVQKLDEKFDGSNIARADLSNGRYVGAGEGNYYWLYKTWASNRTLPTLRKGSQIGVSIYVRINNVVEGNASSGALALEEFTNGKKNGTTHFIPFPNEVNEDFVKYSGVFTLSNEATDGVAMSLGMYGETSSIDFSKPMMALLPPLGEKVVEPIVGACQIDWLKIEKGDTRTPNIDYYKYRGLHSYPSNNPNDYAWEYDQSYFNAFKYVPSEEGYGDIIRIKNKGTYKAYPTFNFTMNGENGLVGLISENGSILQFGNPEDVDGTTSTRVEQGLEQTFWGNTMSPDVTVNAPFSSVYPYLDWKPEKPNLVQGTWNMTKNVDTAIAGFQYSPTTEVWHGPTLMMDIDAPSNGDRTLPVSHHYRFIFDNKSKSQRGRMEFSTFDENGKPLMTAVVRDSTITSNELIFECFWKGKKINGVSLNRRTFQKSFFEVNMDRVGDKLLYRFVQIKQLTTVPGGFSGVTIDNEYKFTWNLEEPDTSNFVKSGVWAMRFAETHHVLMEVTDVQTRWEGTPYYIDMTNYFKDGDNVQIDTKTRELYINGTVNNDLNIVGNQWEGFMVEPGETTFQPLVSSWANAPTVTAELRERYL